MRRRWPACRGVSRSTRPFRSFCSSSLRRSASVDANELNGVGARDRGWCGDAPAARRCPRPPIPLPARPSRLSSSRRPRRSVELTRRRSAAASRRARAVGPSGRYGSDEPDGARRVLRTWPAAYADVVPFSPRRARARRRRPDRRGVDDRGARGLEDASRHRLPRCEDFVGTSAGSIVAARSRPAPPARRPRRRPARTSCRARRGREPRPGRELIGGARRGRRLGRAAARRSRRSRPARSAAAARGRAPERRCSRACRPTRHAWTGCDASIDAPRRALRRAPARHRRGSPPRDAHGVRRARRAAGLRRRGGGGSCTVPWLFAPVRIGGREYVDGGVWSLTNLDAARRGAAPRCCASTPPPASRSPRARPCRRRVLSRPR